MLNISIIFFILLRLTFFLLPLHSNPASLGVAILLIVLFSLGYFVSINITLVAIFITIVYIRGILILFSYFFSLIQNTKIFILPLVLTFFLLLGRLIFSFLIAPREILKHIMFVKNFSIINSFLWIVHNTELVIFFIFILLLRILFVEKVIGLKQKPLRLK